MDEILVVMSIHCGNLMVAHNLCANYIIRFNYCFQKACGEEETSSYLLALLQNECSNNEESILLSQRESQEIK